MSGRGLQIVACALAASAFALLTTPTASAHGARPTAKELARGMVFRGLERAKAGGPCAGGYELRAANGRLGCTHGPDPAPPGVDVRRRRSVAELAAETGESTTSALAGGAVHCIGDGTSGKRVQAIYAYPSGAPDRSADVAPLIRSYAAKMDATFEASAAATGGERHVRFVTESNCALAIDVVPISATARDSFGPMIDELHALGYDRPDRKYLVWTDANVYCGIATLYYDDRAQLDNYNNGNPWVPGMVARVDTMCWDYAETHELVHSIGGVQDTAPNTTPYGHCTDESDLMCYADGAGVVMRQICPLEHEELLDCNHDDYFHTSPPAESYLATHWNTAESSFLATSLDGSGLPSVSAPTVRFGARVGKSAVPVTIEWSASDPDGIVGHRLWQSTDGAAYYEVPLAYATATSKVRSLAPGHRYRFKVEATDGAGNAASTEGLSFLVQTYQETNKAIAYAASWTRRYWTYALGSYQRFAKASGAQARFTFTGRGVAWVARAGATSGKAYVYVDGAYVKTVDLYAPAAAARRVMFSRIWPDSATRTVTVIVAGTAGRPRVDVDAFTVLK